VAMAVGIITPLNQKVILNMSFERRNAKYKLNYNLPEFAEES
jgi:hypothetical protein